MWATHILFVAWQKSDEPKAEAQALAKFGNDKKDKQGTRRFKVVVYKPGRESENLKRLQSGQVYIVGHGAAGYGQIGDVDDEQRVDLLDVNTVCDRLIASGLNAAFSGKVKCFNCHSATAQGNAEPFAKLFATEMRRRTYTHCQYFGYDSSVQLAYKDLAFGGHYKHALEKINGRWCGMDRASGARKPF